MRAIVTRAPLRVTLGGGGTDLPAWYREHGGFVVSAAIDRYVHVVATGPLGRGYVLKHLELEEVDAPEQIRHPILRAALTREWDGRSLELATVGDVPPGTGLGSSGAYTVAVLKALDLAANRAVPGEELAERACAIEIDELGRSVGKQDQYAAALGGVRAYTFRPDDGVEARRIEVGEEVRRALGECFLLFFTGGERSASDLLSHQVNRTLAGDRSTARDLERGAELARESCTLLESGDLSGMGDLMDEQWDIKRRRAPGAITDSLEQLRRRAKRAGAAGITLMGAGGGGFLLAYSEDPERTREAMREAGAPELTFDLDSHGCVEVAGPGVQQS